MLPAALQLAEAGTKAEDPVVENPFRCPVDGTPEHLRHSETTEICSPETNPKPRNLSDADAEILYAKHFIKS